MTPAGHSDQLSWPVIPAYKVSASCGGVLPSVVTLGRAPVCTWGGCSDGGTGILGVVCRQQSRASWQQYIDVNAGLEIISEVGSRGKKTHIWALVCALVCAPKLVCVLVCALVCARKLLFVLICALVYAPKLICALICVLVCAPKLICVLVCAPKPICALVRAPKLVFAPKKYPWPWSLDGKAFYYYWCFIVKIAIHWPQLRLL